MSEKVYDEWIKINIELNNRLEMLKEVNREREKVIKEAEEKGITEEIRTKMEESIKVYERLLEEIKLLNSKSKILKESL